MNKTIRSYDDLLREEKHMEELLQAQKELLLYDFNELKEELKPAQTALTFISRIIIRDKNNLLLTGGLNKTIDLIVRKLLLARSGWLTKLIVPFFLKNYSSHIIADHKDQIIEKLFFWLNGKDGKADPEVHKKEN